MLFSEGTEQFIDLRGSGGPDVGIDNSNCTGAEERLIDCSFSREVSDCNSNSHKVGVRCHEESKCLQLSSILTSLRVVNLLSKYSLRASDIAIKATCLDLVATFATAIYHGYANVTTQ